LLFPRYDFSLAGPIAGCLFAVGGSGARRLVEVLDTEGLLERLPPAATPTSSSARTPQAPCVALRRELLSEGWADLHLRSGGSFGVAEAISGGSSGPKQPPRWALHPVEVPDGRSSGNAVAAGHSLWFLGGSQRAVLRYTLGDPSWQPVGAELDSMRLGASAVAVGCGPPVG